MMKKTLTLMLFAAAFAACEDSVAPQGGRQFTAIATGGEHSCAIASGGEVFCWGRGTDGELGTGDNANAMTPQATKSNLTFKQITLGSAHSCALTEGGRAHCWGWNAFYQTGTAFNSDTRVPSPIDGPQLFTTISAGSYHTCGIALDQRVFCWGYNRWGQNGNGLTQTTIPAEPVVGDLKAISISAGGFHTCALSSTGVAYCWGSNEYGQLGIRSDALLATTPVPVFTNLRFTAINAGFTHTCGIATTGELYCWGSAVYGEIGDGAPFKEGLPGPSSPTRVANLTNVIAVSAGVHATCATAGDHFSYCWGRGTEGQLGNADGVSFSVPQQVRSRLAPGFDLLASDGDTHACGINNGGIYCWGTGRSGQLGTGRSITNVPERIGS